MVVIMNREAGDQTGNCDCLFCMSAMGRPYQIRSVKPLFRCMVGGQLLRMDRMQSR